MQETPPGLAAAAFRTAFGALPVEAALALREGRAARHLPGEGGSRFAGLLATADLDAFLRTDGARRPRVAMADDSRAGSAAVPEAEYALPDGRVDLPRLLRRFDAGASLVLSQFDETHPPLQRLCRGLERVFLHAVQANIYLTPPAAQGFRPHYDTHDVLVLQLEGRKRWRVWEGEALPRPTRRTPWAGQAPPEAAPAVLTLAPGDALYLPRGVLHDAAALPGEASLHVTLGFLEPSWAEALRRLLDVLEAEDPALRESVPTWRLEEGRLEEGRLEEGRLEQGGLGAGLAAVLARLGAPGQAVRLAELLLRALPEDRQPLPGRGLLTPMPTGRLRLAEGMHHHVACDADGQAVLRWAGEDLPLGPGALEELAALAEGAVPRDAGLAARLWALGLLEPG
ncbi:MAG: cupin domain-containing protein [Rubritepida sp.]|nr:cupin domain-containing protein [Rubritepida sp.]